MLIEERKIDLNAAGTYGQTIAYTIAINAAIYNQIGILKWLDQRKDIDLNRKDASGYSLAYVIASECAKNNHPNPTVRIEAY